MNKNIFFGTHVFKNRNVYLYILLICTFFLFSTLFLSRAQAISSPLTSGVTAVPASGSTIFGVSSAEVNVGNCQAKFAKLAAENPGEGYEEFVSVCPTVANCESMTGAIGNLLTIVVKAISKDACTTQAQTLLLQEFTTSRDPVYLDFFAYLQTENNNSLQGIVDQSIVALYEEQPASGVLQTQQVVAAIWEGGTINAQWYYPGTGFSLLQPIQQFWGWSLNIVYSFLIVIVIGIALAILFQSNMSAGASITVQNAIPNVVIAMVLIPLSYPISGFFIDLVTLGTNAAHGFIIGPQSPGYAALLDYEANNPGSRKLFPDDPRMTWALAGANADITEEFISSSTGFSSNFSILSGINNFMATNKLFGTDILTWVAQLVNAVVQIILFLTGLRIVWKLFRKFLYFLILPIASPFIFASIAIPGNGFKSIESYSKYMGSASLFYIVTYTMFLMTFVFSNTAFQTSIPDFATTGYIPPLLGLQGLLTNFSGLSTGSSGTEIVLGFVAIAIYLNIPKTLDSINQQFGIVDELPEIFKDTWQSLQDSISVGKKGIDLTTQTATAASKIPGVVGNINRTGTRLNQSIQNLGDTFRGRRVGEAGTSLYRRREAAKNQIEKLEAMRNTQLANGQYGQARDTEARIEGEKKRLASMGESYGVSDANKEHKTMGMKVEAVWGIEKGGIFFTKDQLLTYYANIYLKNEAVLSSMGFANTYSNIIDLQVKVKNYIAASPVSLAPGAAGPTFTPLPTIPLSINPGLKFVFTVENGQFPGDIGEYIYYSSIKGPVAYDRLKRRNNQSDNYMTDTKVDGLNAPFLSRLASSPRPEGSVLRNFRNEIPYKSINNSTSYNSVGEKLVRGGDVVLQWLYETKDSTGAEVNLPLINVDIDKTKFDPRPTPDNKSWSFDATITVIDFFAFVNTVSQTSSSPSNEVQFKAKFQGRVLTGGPLVDMESNVIKLFTGIKP